MLQSAELTAAAIVRIGNHWNLLFLCSSPGTHFSLGLPLRNFHPFCRFGEQDRPGSCKFGFLNCFKWRTNPWYEKPAGQLSSPPPPPEEPKNCSNGGSRWCVGSFFVGFREGVLLFFGEGWDWRPKNKVFRPHFCLNFDKFGLKVA